MDTRVCELDCIDFSYMNGLSCIISENQLVSLLLWCRTKKLWGKPTLNPKSTGCRKLKSIDDKLLIKGSIITLHTNKLLVAKDYMDWIFNDMFWIYQDIFLGYQMLSIGNLQFLHQHILMCILSYPFLSIYSVFLSNCLSNSIQIINLLYPMLSMLVSYFNLDNYPYVSNQNLIL